MILNDFWQQIDCNLYGKNVILEPICKDHYSELVGMADQTAVWSAELLTPEFERWFKAALKERKERRRCPYVIRQIDTKHVVGSISYYEIVEKHHRCNIGYAWLGMDTWGTKIFPDCMLTLLEHGFGILHFNRIAINADTRNIRSQRAIEKLGAVQEGIFRKYIVDYDNTPCNIVYYSVLINEWPRIKENLEKRLAEGCCSH